MMKSAFAFKEEFYLVIQYGMKSYLSGDKHHFTSLSVKRVPGSRNDELSQQTKELTNEIRKLDKKVEG